MVLFPNWQGSAGNPPLFILFSCSGFVQRSVHVLFAIAFGPFCSFVVLQAKRGQNLRSPASVSLWETYNFLQARPSAPQWILRWSCTRLGGGVMKSMKTVQGSCVGPQLTCKISPEMGGGESYPYAAIFRHRKKL